MAIIQNNSNQAITPEQAAANVVDSHKKLMSAKYNDVNGLFSAVAAFVWSNKMKKTDGSTFTPQDIFNLYGTDAAELVRLSNAVCAMIQAYTGQSVTVVPSGKTLTINNDGTVTVGDVTP